MIFLLRLPHWLEVADCMRELGGDSPTKYGWLVEVVVEGWSFETFINVGIETGGGAWKATVDTLTSFLS